MRKPPPRPAVVLHHLDGLDPGSPLVVAVGTTQVSRPLQDEEVLLPWHKDGLAKTKLRKPTAIICNWVAEVPQNEVRNVGGPVPDSHMKEILQKVLKYHGRTEPNG